MTGMTRGCRKTSFGRLIARLEKDVQSTKFDWLKKMSSAVKTETPEEKKEK